MPMKTSAPTSNNSTPPRGATGAELLWIPLRAGKFVVRWSGVIIDAAMAFFQRRPRSTLLHTALQVYTPEGRYVMRAAGRFRVFRYEIRRWFGGSISCVPSFAVPKKQVVLRLQYVFHSQTGRWPDKVTIEDSRGVATYEDGGDGYAQLVE
jgi:hypothetical protein